jgi:hypothetical protein
MAATKKVSGLEPLPTVSESAPTGKTIEPVKTNPVVTEEAHAPVDPGQVGYHSRALPRKA